MEVGIGLCTARRQTVWNRFNCTGQCVGSQSVVLVGVAVVMTVLSVDLCSALDDGHVEARFCSVG